MTKQKSIISTLPIPVEMIERRIYFIRGQKVMIDRHLAELYDVKAIALRQQVKRNKARFPADFMFQLSKTEAEILVSQNVIPSKQSLGGYLPYVFTEQGVAMLSSILNSERAIQVNTVIMRTFVKLREILSTHKQLAHKLDELEKKYQRHDKAIKAIFDAIRELMNPQTGNEIGFSIKRKK